uniref:Uncharacterized protein n=1 Tax=Anguilla anguilla TaxID=7936 RepID=A0A0E9WZ16_ANGAN
MPCGCFCCCTEGPFRKPKEGSRRSRLVFLSAMSAEIKWGWDKERRRSLTLGQRSHFSHCTLPIWLS